MQIIIRPSLFVLASLIVSCGRSPTATGHEERIPHSTQMSPAASSAKTELLAVYMKISAALAADNVVDAKAAALNLVNVADKAGLLDIANQATATAEGADIAAVRAKFKILSVTLEPLVAGDASYIVMYCPMEQADWIQTSKDVTNPYFGAAMLTCGAPKTAK